MPKELTLILGEKEVNQLNDMLQELPAKYANPLLNYLQSLINAQRKAEMEAEGKGNAVMDSQEIEEIEPVN